MAVAVKEWPLVEARPNDDKEGRDNTEEEDNNQDSRHQEQQLQHNKKKDNNVQVDDTSTIHHDDTGKKSKKRRRSLSPPNCNRNEITSTTPSLKDLLVGNDVSFTHCHKYNSNDNTTSNCIATSLQNYDNNKNNITGDINAENTTNKSVQHYQKKSKYFHTPKKSCGGGVSSQSTSSKHSSRLNDNDSIQEDSSNPDPNSTPPLYETVIARHKKQLEINKVKGIPTNKIPLPPKGGILSIDIGIVANTVDLNGYTGETQYEKAILESSALMLRRNQGKPLPASVDATLYQCKPENVNTNAEIEAMDLSKRGVHRVGGRRKNIYTNRGDAVVENRGITLTKDHQWQVRITHNSKQQYIGIFDVEEIALKAAKLARDKLTNGSAYEGEELKQIIKCACDAAHADYESRIAPLVAKHIERKELWRKEGLLRLTQPSIEDNKSKEQVRERNRINQQATSDRKKKREEENERRVNELRYQQLSYIMAIAGNSEQDGTTAVVNPQIIELLKRRSLYDIPGVVNISVVLPKLPPIQDVRKRNRFHAKRSRDKKREKNKQVAEMIQKLERENALLSYHAKDRNIPVSELKEISSTQSAATDEEKAADQVSLPKKKRKSTDMTVSTASTDESLVNTSDVSTLTITTKRCRTSSTTTKKRKASTEPSLQDASNKAKSAADDQTKKKRKSTTSLEDEMKLSATNCDPVDMKTDSSEKLGELEKESTRLNITVAPGPLGVGIQTTTTGQCVVYSKSNAQSPLKVNDIILSLSVNGIELSKESGFYAWGKMFKAYSPWTRNLVVLRSSPSSSDSKGDESTTRCPHCKQAKCAVWCSTRY